MSAKIYQIRDYQSKRAIERAHAELEKGLAEIAKAIIPVNVLEDVHYHAPDKDPA